MIEIKQLVMFLKKVTETWSRDSGLEDHATVGRLSIESFNIRLFQAIWDQFSSNSLNGDVSVVGGHVIIYQTSQTTFLFTVSSNWGPLWKKPLNCHLDRWLEGHAKIGRLSNNVFQTFQVIWLHFETKSLNGHARVVEVTRPSAVCQTTIYRPI